MKRNSVLLVAAMSAAHFAFGLNVSSGPIVLGEWNSSFSRGMDYANEYHVPMLVFWGNVGCGNCGNMRRSCATDEFKAWQADRQIVMIFDETPGSSAKAFAKNSSGQYPYMAVYWLREDGTATTNRFSGLRGSMPASSVDEKGNQRSLAMQLAASVDMFIEGYKVTDFKGGEFLVPEYEGNRLEAVADETTWVDVPLTRQLVDATIAAEADFVATFPNGSATTNKLDWQAGERTKTVRVTLPEGLSVGDKVSLALFDVDAKLRAESSIAIIAPMENCVRNPDWLTDDFDFGRWTFDYDAATNAVAQKIAEGKDAYTLAMFSGVLWCPYCRGMENSLLAAPEFAAWAKENNVALVLFDQGRASTPATAAGTMSPRLLTYDPDPRLDPTSTVSGAGYLSRKSVLKKDAEAIIARTVEYTARWLAPETTSARLGNPTLLLVKNDEVVGRFASRRDNDRVYDPAENIGRLNDFLKLWDRDDENDDYRTTTTRSHAVGGSSKASFQISDRNEYFKLTGVAAGQIKVVRTGGEEDPDLTFSLMQGGKALASGVNKLEANVSAEMLAAGDFYLRASAYAAASTLFFNPESGEPVETTLFTATFDSSFVLVPEERESAFVPSEASVVMTVEEGLEYRLKGFTEASVTNYFTVKDEAHAIYVAKVGGEVTLERRDEVEEVSYQLWNPGAIGFALASQAVVESDASVEISLVRTDGSSGAVSAKVALVGDGSVPPERYVWEDATVKWADGDASKKTVTLFINDDIVFDGDQALTFVIADISGYGIETVLTNHVVTIKEDDSATVGVLAVDATVPEVSKKATIVAAEGAEVAFSVSRQDGAEGAVAGVIAASAGAFKESEGAEQVLEWANRDRVPQRIATLVLPTIEECPTKKVTVTLAGQGIGVEAASRKFTVQLVSAGAPAFVSSSAAFDLVRYVSFSETIGIDLDTIEKGEGAVRVSKISGSQPPGVGFDWNSATGDFIISGTPTKAGTYVAHYQISQVRGGSTVLGGTVGVTFSIAELGAGSSAVNPSVATSRTFKNVPVVDETTGRLAGILTLSIPTTGKLSAKYTTKAGAMSLSCKSWAQCAEDGTLKADLYTRDGSYSVSVEAKADGSVGMTVWDPELPGHDLKVSVGGVEAWSKSNPADDWRGIYTVAHMPTDIASGSDRIASKGSAGISIKMTTASAAKSGTFTYAGFLPNGTSISGSTTLQGVAGEDSCLLPVFSRSTTDCFSSLLSVSAGAAAAYEASGAEDPSVQRVVFSADCVKAAWANSNRKTEYADFEVEYEAFGSYYVPGQDFENALIKTDVLPYMKFSITTGDLADSDIYGSVGAPAVATLSVSKDKISAQGVEISLDKASGIVKGKFSLPFDGRTVTATYRAVVLPGWTGCGCYEQVDLPFLVGAYWFADTFLYQEDWEACSEPTAPYISVPFKRGSSVTAETSAFIN